MYLLAATLAINGCAGRNNRGTEVPPKPRNTEAAQSRSNEVRPLSNVSLRIVPGTGESRIMEIKNESDTPIFLSYSPSTEGSGASFVSYDLQKRKGESEDFSHYGVEFHHVPNLHPVDSKAVIRFLVNYPRDKGEYRVKVSYYEDEKVYRMISERLVDMTPVERNQAEQARRYAFSDTFFVPAKRQDK